MPVVDEAQGPDGGTRPCLPGLEEAEGPGGGIVPLPPDTEGGCSTSKEDGAAAEEPPAA